MIVESRCSSAMPCPSEYVQETAYSHTNRDLQESGVFEDILDADPHR